MKKFTVSAKEMSPLQSLTIEAENIEAAKEEYFQKWSEGYVFGSETTLDEYEVKEEE